MSTRSRLAPLGSILALALLVAACSSGATPTPAPTATPAAETPAPPAGTPEPTPAAASEDTAEIRSFAFKPGVLTVAVGATVTWTNRDGVGHTATADDGSTFNSGPLGSGETFSFTFATAGTFAYHCAIHPRMTASVVVTP